LNPNDADGWCELGFTYQLLAAEELNWSANNILEHKGLINGYQKVSFFMQLFSAPPLQETYSAENRNRFMHSLGVFICVICP